MSKSIIVFLFLSLFSVWTTAVHSAERIVLRYSGSILEASVTVDELAELAEKGTVSQNLQFCLDQVNQDPKNLRTVLTTVVPINGVQLSRALNHFIGEFVLDLLGEVIQTPARVANRQALRSAIINSALPDNQLTLLEILRNYPTAEILINGDRLTEIVQQLQNLHTRLGL